MDKTNVNNVTRNTITESAMEADIISEDGKKKGKSVEGADTKDLQVEIQSYPAHRRPYDKTNRKYLVFVFCFLIHMLYGVFTSMVSVMFVDIVREFNASRSEVSLMQSLSRGVIFGAGSFGEFLIRKLGITKCIVSGSLMVSICLLSTAFATNVTTIVIVIGVGAGFGLMLPMLTTFIVMERAFDPVTFPRFVAYIVVGGGLGQVMSPYLSESILQEYGWRGLCIIMSGLLANLLVCTIGIHFNAPKMNTAFDRKSGKASCSLKILQSPMYVTYLLTMFPFGLTGFVEGWYIPDFMVTIGYTREQGSILLTVIGVSSTFGRFFGGLLHPVCVYTKTHIIYHWIYIFLILAAAHIMFPLVPNYDLLYAVSVLYGIVFGMMVAQGTPVVFQSVDRSMYSIAVGIDTTTYGISSTLGGVISGSIVDSTGSYSMVFYFAFICSVFCSLCCLFLLVFEVVRQKWKRNKSQALEITHI